MDVISIHTLHTLHAETVKPPLGLFLSPVILGVQSWTNEARFGKGMLSSLVGVTAVLYVRQMDHLLACHVFDERQLGSAR